jgi:hypothetical protein
VGTCTEQKSNQNTTHYYAQWDLKCCSSYAAQNFPVQRIRIFCFQYRKKKKKKSYILYSVGYSNEILFSRIFGQCVVSVRVNKKLEGLPGDYRVRVQEELISDFMFKNEEIRGKRLGDL